MSVLKLILVGNLGQNATVNIVNGKNCINFSVAHSEKWKDAQGVQKERTTWVSCAYWSDKTNIVPYLTKGSTVYVEGTVEARAYTTQRGENGVSLNCRVFDIKLLGGQKKDDNGNVQKNPWNGQQGSGSDISPATEDAPF